MEHQHTLKQTILTLASLLADVSEEREMAESERDDLRADLGALQIAHEDLQDSHHAIMKDRDFVMDRNGELRHHNEDLRQRNSDLQAREPVPSYLETIQTRMHQEQHNLLLSLFQNPSTFDHLATYMNDTGQRKWDKKEKIAVIKDVRDITRWGLLECKNFVESYHWAPAAPVVEADDRCGCGMMEHTMTPVKCAIHGDPPKGG